MAELKGRTDGERIRALQTVGFELRMMAHASALLRQAQLADVDPMAHNAFIDSAHMHARALVAFFLMPRSRASDIHRMDFETDWVPAPAEAVKRLMDNYRLLNKYLAHMTWERVSKDAPPWNYPNIATDVIDVAEAWSEHLVSADHPIWENLRPDVSLARKALSGSA